MKDLNRKIGPQLSRIIFGTALPGFLVLASGNASAAPVDGHAIGIGTSCGAALAGVARNPDEEEKIRAAYVAGADVIKALKPKVSAAEVSEAVGILKAEEADGVARQPEAAEKLAALAATCIADLLSFKIK